MRNLREAVVILAAVALAGFAAYGLAVASVDLDGGLGGWGTVAATIFAGLATLVALVSSILAALVARRRGWRLGLALVTLAAVVAVAITASTTDGAQRLSALAALLTFVVATWLPVGARWWLDKVSPEPVESAEPPVSRRAAVTAGALCGGVVVVVSLIAFAVAGSSIPSALLGFALVLVAVGAFASGRVPDTVALALLVGVALAAVVFRLPELPDGSLVTGALALVVLVAFSWRTFAARITSARRAAVVPQAITD